MLQLLDADVMFIRIGAVYLSILLLAVVAYSWARVAAGRVLDEEADDLARVKYDRPLTITGDRPHA